MLLDTSATGQHCGVLERHTDAQLIWLMLLDPPTKTYAG